MGTPANIKAEEGSSMIAFSAQLKPIQEHYEHLLFRRQFLMTPDKCRPLERWQHKNFRKFHIYAHPDIELNIIDGNH
jgi:hypothetical protein